MSERGKTLRHWLAAGVLSAGLSVTAPSAAQEVAAGTLLDAASIDSLFDQTLDGEPIHSVLIGQQEG